MLEAFHFNYFLLFICHFHNQYILDEIVIEFMNPLFLHILFYVRQVRSFFISNRLNHHYHFSSVIFLGVIWWQSTFVHPMVSKLLSMNYGCVFPTYALYFLLSSTFLFEVNFTLDQHLRL